MKRRQLLAIFTALAVSLCSAALMVGCSGKTVYYTDFAYDANGKPIPAGEQVSLVSNTDDASSTAPAADTGDDTSSEEPAEESSEAPAEESSEEPAEESSEEPAEESSEEPAEESSEEPAEESSEEPAEESSEEPAAEGVVIKFQKPTEGGWAEKPDVYAYVYNKNDQTKNNAAYPGVQMTDDGDNIYSYVVPAEIENPVVVFNRGKEESKIKENKYKCPPSGAYDVEDGKTYTVE